MQLLANPNHKSLKLKSESDKDFSCFCKFLELGSMADLVQELKGKQSERNLFFIAKNNKWNERKAAFEANITATVLYIYKTQPMFKPGKE